MKNGIMIWMLAGLVALSVQSEIRIWTATTGSQISAEFIEETGGRVILRTENGRELKVPRSYLSPSDIKHLDSLNVPVLGIRPDVKIESIFKSGVGVVQVVKYVIEVRKVSSPPYESPVNVVLYIIGGIGDEEGAYVVLQRTQERVTFSSAKRNPTITGPDLSLGSPELQKKYDIDYVGYLVIVSVPGGQIIAVESDAVMLKTNAGFISKFKAGDLFGSDMKPLD